MVSTPEPASTARANLENGDGDFKAPAYDPCRMLPLDDLVTLVAQVVHESRAVVPRDHRETAEAIVSVLAQVGAFASARSRRIRARQTPFTTVAPAEFFDRLVAEDEDA